MKAQTVVPSLTARIENLTGVSTDSVQSTLRMIGHQPPSTRVDCEEVIKNEFATKEEKDRARTIRAEILMKEIENATSRSAYMTFLGLPKFDLHLMELGARKLAAFATKAGDLTQKFIRSDDSSTTSEVRNAVNSIFRGPVLELPISLKDAIELWRFFLGTPESEVMEGKINDLTEARIEEIDEQTQGRGTSLYNLYYALPLTIPSLKEYVLSLALHDMSESEIRDVLRRTKETLRSKENHCDGFESAVTKYQRQAEIASLKQVVEMLTLRLDERFSAIVSSISSEDELLKALPKSIEPTLPKARAIIEGKLTAIWTEELSKKPSFERSLGIFSEMRRTISVTTASKMLDLAFREAKDHIRLTDPGYEEKIQKMMEATRSSIFEEDVLQLWLESKPLLDELRDKYEDVRSGCRLSLLSAIVKRSDMFDEALSSLDVEKSASEERRLLVEHLAAKIRSVQQGMLALARMHDGDRYDGRRAIVLKATLEFVSTEEELRLIIPFMGKDKSDQEVRLLVEKAKALLSDMPAS